MSEVASQHLNTIKPIEFEEKLGHPHHARLGEDAVPRWRKDTEYLIIRVSRDRQNTIHASRSLTSQHADKKVYHIKLQPAEKPRTRIFTCQPNNGPSCQRGR
jgi:hypothetical protein